MRIVSSPPAASLKSADIIGIGCFEDAKHFSLQSATLEPAARDKIQKILKSKSFSGKAGETFFIPAATRSAGSVYLIGLGPKEKFTLEKVRRAAAKLLSQAKAFRHESLRLELDGFDAGFSAGEIAQAAVEGLRLADYRFDKYKSKPAPESPVKEASLISSAKSGVARALREGEALCEAVSFARDLANEPANVMTPARLAQAARKMASESSLSCRVLAKPELQRLGMGGILGVSQGSAFGPQLIVLESRGRSRRGASSRPIVLVGKGVTFDSGGISLKPGANMDKMKFDMSGAAAVIATMKAAAALRLPLCLVGLVPVVENMPSSTAQRPGDIIRCFNGKTVEVLNTDAEGRLILADALAYAERWKPHAMVDIATLTGACAATFGDVTSAVMGTDADLVHRLIEAGERAGERCWELPLWDEYSESIRATYADIQNISKAQAGTITAGMFLKEFASHTKAWAHLDVAGTAWTDHAKPLAAVGSTGVGVRLLVQLLKSYAE